MNTVVAAVTKGNFAQAIKMAEQLPADADAIAAMDGIATQFGAGEERNVDRSSIAKGCASAEARLQKVCIRAYVGGLIEGGKPGEEHIEAREFCEKRLQGSSLQSECYSGLVSSLYAWLSKDKASQICSTFPEDTKRLCS
jgi:hypothetical protein